MTPNHMKYPSLCCYMPLEILGLFKAERSRNFIATWPQGHTRRGYLSCCTEDMRTNLALFRNPSSDGVLAMALFFESHDFTPPTRSSISESVSVSSPLRKQETSSGIHQHIGVKTVILWIQMLQKSAKLHVIVIAKCSEKESKINRNRQYEHEASGRLFFQSLLFKWSNETACVPSLDKW